MRDYGQYCPVTIGSEVIGDRWTPLILREMLAIGSTRFNEIERGLPGISRTLLSQRLRHLERKGVVARVPAAGGRGSEYHLTPAGSALMPVLMAMGEWAVRWMYAEPTPPDADPQTLLWWMHRMLAHDQLPDERVVIEFRFEGEDAMTIWLVLDRGEASVCAKHPGFETDLLAVTTGLTLLRIHSGIDTVAEALADGSLRLEGPPALRRGFSRWFVWSPFASLVREVSSASRSAAH